MAGFVIAVLGCLLSFGLGAVGLARSRVLVIGGVLAFAWIVSMAIGDRGGEQPPLWFGIGLVLLLYGIWCGGLWLGVRLRRLRRATPG
ncbi:MAG TPA: hypothetical protein VLB89_03910 [Gaiellaceae bacterium]|nr:hypothetical protein [Gaiellaceae bacterium]